MEKDLKRVIEVLISMNESKEKIILGQRMIINKMANAVVSKPLKRQKYEYSLN